MPPARFRPRTGAAAALRAVLAGTLLIGSIGSCELPKPQIPSIGSEAPAGPPTATADGHARGTRGPIL